jgi:hypothetical protein
VPSFAFCFGIALITVGAGLAVFERRVMRRLVELHTGGDARHGRFLRERAVRRLKIGLWILLLGMTVTAGETIEPRDRPIHYMSCWIAAAITAVVLVRLAAIDYIALRRHWGGEILRTETELERARRELKRHIPPDAEQPNP